MRSVHYNDPTREKKVIPKSKKDSLRAYNIQFFNSYYIHISYSMTALILTATEFFISATLLLNSEKWSSGQ